MQAFCAMEFTGPLRKDTLGLDEEQLAWATGNRNGSIVDPLARRRRGL